MENRYNSDGHRIQQTYGKGRQKNVQMAGDELDAILNMALKSIEEWKPGQQATKYPDTKEGFLAFEIKSYNYLQTVKEANLLAETSPKLIPDVESWAIYLGISRQTLAAYKRRKGKWKEFIEYIYEIIAAGKKQLALRGCIPSVMAIFDLTNNHSYHNTNEFHVTNVVEEIKPQLSADELINHARMLPGFTDETALSGETPTLDAENPHTLPSANGQESTFDGQAMELPSDE